MHRPVFFFFFIVTFVVGTVGVLAQDGSGEPPAVDQDLFEQGQTLYRANCTICHQSDGTGDPPTFPALAGNENLESVELITMNIHEGRNAMPAFPQLNAQQIAALATYVRNAWENEIGGVEASEVEDLLGDGSVMRSIWDGVYTQVQAERGEPLYTRCAACHGVRRLGQNVGPTSPERLFMATQPADPDSERVYMHVSDPAAESIGPPLGGDFFLRNWDGNVVGTLFLVSSTTMPLDQPGAMTAQEYVDIIAFLLAVSDVPAGENELPTNVQELNEILIEIPPEEE